MIHITKKRFKADCDLNHVYGRGRGKHNAIYCDWRVTDKGRGFKYGVACSIENGTKAELLEHFYQWVCNEVTLPWWIRYKFAPEDQNRFKVPISLNF
jgi:hypothetical protein